MDPCPSPEFRNNSFEDSRSTHTNTHTYARNTPSSFLGIYKLWHVVGTFGLGAPAPEAFRGQNNQLPFVVGMLCFARSSEPLAGWLFWAWPLSVCLHAPILTLALGISV